MTIGFTQVDGIMQTTVLSGEKQLPGGQGEIHPAVAILPVPGSEDVIALAPHAIGPSGQPFQNLVRCRPDGTLVWRAELPELGADAYVSAQWAAEGLTAHSWSGFIVILDPQTGRIRSKRFTK